ncbi:MAG TPA: S8 family peptidase, partial [Paludibacter sp.]|nr:S8 family peptidase [Paludibacter sp.]
LLTELAALSAQTNYYFYVQFANKNNSPYSLSKPSAFLSERAIARRTAFSIASDSTDLPVNPAYLQQIENLGIHVHCRSKWMNGATVILPDSAKMSQVRALPFVRFVEYTGKLFGAALAPKQKAKAQTNLNYGIATTQINQFNGKYLHDEGFRGKGIQIGVIDAGFMNANTNPCFDSLRLQGRLLGTKDIINPNSNIFAEDSHGASVLSTMTGNLNGQYLGTAPEASYWLIRTEYAPTEYKVETDFWCSGVEFADSVGVDVVNSSLGYYTFDDLTMGFTYADMNGKVSRASRAATMASKKGIVVVVAAGNEGNKAWHYIGSPADADGIVSVGAVQADSTSSPFSSFGPTADNRIKPEICAMGSLAAIVNPGGVASYSNGTSFASPIMAGMVACLLQRYKAFDPNPVVNVFLNSLFASGNLRNNPTAQKGYGIPNFSIAERNLPVYNSLTRVDNDIFSFGYNSQNKTLNIRILDGSNPKQAFVRIYSTTGKLAFKQAITETTSYLELNKIPVGIYAVAVSLNGATETRKIIIQ